MNTRQHIQKKHPSQSTYTPVQNLYQTRAFDIQQQPSHSSSGQENVDLDADHEQSQYKLYNLPYIPVNAPGTEPPPPIQTQLNSGEPTNYYQQGSADVAWYNRPTYPYIPVNAPGTEPPPPIQTQLNSGEPTNYYQQGSADVPWYNRPTYPYIPVNAPGTEPPPPIQTQLNSGEPTNYYQQGSADVAWYNRPIYPNIPVNAPGTEPPPPIQTKLTIGEPGDKYEQEADQVASQVVQQINSPVPVQSAQGQTVQREEVPEEEEQVQAKSISNTIQREEVPEEEQLQAKSISDTIQREEVPEEEEQVQAKSISNTIQREEVTEEEQLQAKSISDTIQREEVPEEEEQVQAKSISDTIQREELPEEEQLQGKSLKGEMAATPNLETSIQGAKGSGQPLDENIRQPMEKAFGGVDFSQVKVHNDTQSDQLNKSIQARAFTTGTDVFFRGGEYNPGSRGGQELIAHELTHVVQQNSNSVARKVNSKNSNNLQLKRIKNPVVTSQINTIQRVSVPDQGQGTEQSKQALKAQFAQDTEANDLKQKLQTANKEKEKAVNVQSQLKSAASQAGVEAPEMGQLGEVPDANQALQEMNAAPEKLTAGIQSSGSPQAQPVMRKAEDSAVNQVSFNTSKPVIQRGLWGSIKKGFKKVGGAIASGAKAVGGAVVSGAKAVGGAVVDGAKWIGDKAAQGWNALKEGASKAWNAVKSAASKAWNAVTSWVGKVFAIAKAWIQKQIAKAKQKLTQVAMKATGMKDKMGALLEATNEKYGLTKKLKAGTQTAKEKIKGFGKTAANFGLAAAEGAGKALAGPIRPGWWTDKADEYKQLWSKENKGAYGEGKLGDVMRVLKTLDMTLGNVGEIAGWVSLITAIAAPIAGAFGVTAPLVPILGSISVVAAQITAVTALIRLALNAILAIYNLIRLTMAKDPEEKAKIQAAFFGDLTTIALSALSAGGVGKAGQKAKDSMNTYLKGNGKALVASAKEGWKNGNKILGIKTLGRLKGLADGAMDTQAGQRIVKLGVPIATGAGKQVYKDFSKKDSTVQKKADVTNLVQKQDTGEQTNDGMSAQLQQAIMTATQNMEMTNQQAQTEQDGEIKSLSDMENKAQEMNNGTENMKKEASKESAAKV